ncbi:hypothetical protein [Leuconostoc suionicum]|uniref:hypothetical protein n=1 Tax=Leuconostoc suionicum TaxID=1511761 RepID=UPI00300D75FE
MTFTPKLKAYIQKHNNPLNISAIIKAIIYFIVLFYGAHWGITVLFSNNFFIDFAIGLTNIAIFSALGIMFVYIFKNNSKITNKNFDRMEKGEFRFDEIENWTGLSLTTNMAKTIVSFKASEAFASKQDPSNTAFQTKFEKQDVILSIQVNDNLSFQDVVDKVAKTFGTTPTLVKHHSATSSHMYEITIHLGDVKWIKDQDIIEYELLES